MLGGDRELRVGTAVGQGEDGVSGLGGRHLGSHRLDGANELLPDRVRELRREGVVLSAATRRVRPVDPRGRDTYQDLSPLRRGDIDLLHDHGLGAAVGMDAHSAHGVACHLLLLLFGPCWLRG